MKQLPSGIGQIEERLPRLGNQIPMVVAHPQARQLRVQRKRKKQENITHTNHGNTSSNDCFGHLNCSANIFFLAYATFICRADERVFTTATEAAHTCE